MHSYPVQNLRKFWICVIIGSLAMFYPNPYQETYITSSLRYSNTDFSESPLLASWHKAYILSNMVGQSMDNGFDLVFQKWKY